MKFCGRSSCRKIWGQNLWMKHIQDFRKIEWNWVKLNEIGWNWVKLRVAIFAIFLTFVISCNFRQFWPIFVAVSGDLIGHFLYTSNWNKLMKIGWNWLKLVKIARRWNFVAVLLAGEFESKIYGWNIFKIFKKLNKIG